MRRAVPFTLLFAAVSLFARAGLADSTKVFDAEVPNDGLDHFFVPFDVPDGTKEIEILHKGNEDANILDFGVLDPSGYRGWGGGTKENAVIGEKAASRAYVPGPLPTGTWKVVVGKAKIVASPATYHIEVTVRSAATLPDQTDRKPYVPVAALEKNLRYYAVDFHTHSRESTDARADLGLDEMLDFAATKGLDAIEISDHNTITQLDYFTDAQARHPHTLLIPGIEFTTYAGHANAIGATKWVDHKIGQPGVTTNGAVDQILGQGALFSINHPALDLGNLCIGCAWKHDDLDFSKLSALEIETGAFETTGFIFLPNVMTFWEKALATGKHVPAIGGSDDHKAGKDEGTQFTSTIGQPVTMVQASELSVAGILDGIKNGRTVVKLEDIHDPMIEMTSEVPPAGDTVKAKSTIFHAHVTGLQDLETFRWVKNGTPMAEVEVTKDPFDAELSAPAPATGEDHYRAEVLLRSKPHTITSHLFVALDPAGPDPVAAQGGGSSGCAAGGSDEHGGASPWAVTWLALFGAAGAVARRLRRRAA